MAIGLGTDVEYLGSNASGGMCIGLSSTEKVGFYGTTPVAQQTVTAVVTTATTATNEAAITRIYTALVNLGLIVTA